MTDLGDALLDRTAELIEIGSVSRNERRLADLVAAELSAIDGLTVHRVGDNVIARTSGSRARRVVLAGHLDTVPSAGNEVAKRDGEILSGLGAADMKSGLAVLLALAPHAANRRVESTFVFYAREEIARSESGLLEVEAADPELLHGDAALILEPTDAVVEAGCQGSMRVEITRTGVRSHSARPWVGVNAIHRLRPVLDAITAFGDQRVIVDGCEYRESLQAVGVSGGGTGNVVPDRAVLLVNYRFAPDKSIDAARAALNERLAYPSDPQAGDDFEVVDAAPGARPFLDSPLIAALVEASGQEPRAKVAWTDVAFFAERGIPAANFGPGDPLLAHRADEFVTKPQVARTYEVLDRVLGEIGSTTRPWPATAGATP